MLISMYTLPKPYLSYSAMSLWQNNKEQFRRRYYLNEPGIETAQTIFGKKVHKIFEDDPNIPGSETKFECEIDKGLKIMGYVDSFNKDDLSIIDFKTSHNEKTWTPLTVAKNKQLVFYSLMVFEKYGRFNRVATLKWIETRFRDNTIVYQGRTYERQGREMELTGKEETFKRKIYKWEITALKKEIINAAKEITDDYISWKKISTTPAKELQESLLA